MVSDDLIERALEAIHPPGQIVSCDTIEDLREYLSRIPSDVLYRIIDKTIFSEELASMIADMCPGGCWRKRNEYGEWLEFFEKTLESRNDYGQVTTDIELSEMVDVSRQGSLGERSSMRLGNVYREALDKENDATFAKALDVAWKIIHGIDQPTRDRIYESLDRGKAILRTEEQCAGYMAWFAKKHRVKFTAAFALLPKEICQNVIDLFDWGCGIGLASFALRDWYDQNFPYRKYSKKIRRVTLIEPSDIALEWSGYNTRRCFPEAKVLEVRKRFSELQADDFGDTGNPTQCRLHIFSNILDMGIVRGNHALSDLVATVRDHALGWDDLFVLISPDYGNVESAFSSFIAQLSAGKDYEVIPILEPRKYSWSREEGDDVEAKGVLAVWQIRSKVKSSLLKGFSPKWRHVYDQLILDETAGLEHRKLIDYLHAQLNDIPDSEIEFSYRPNIYGTTPDIVIFRKDYLPVVISIGRRKAQDKSAVKPDKEFMEPVDIVRRELIKNNKILFHMKEAFGLISVLAYSPEANILCGFKARETGEGGRSFVVYEWKDTIPWKQVSSDVGLAARNAVKDLLARKKCPATIAPLNFDVKQKRLSVSHPGRQKVTGCFGSGKTTVLVERAVNAYRRTHKRVLILTYNISLRNHIEHAISQRMDVGLTGREFLILNIHQFIRTYGMLLLPTGTNNVVSFLGDGKDALKKLLAYKNDLAKFQTILVDECQDFEYYWMEILTEVFLETGGEYVLFGDEKQNVYGRELDHKKIKTNIQGVANILNQCHRSSGKLLNFIVKFQSLMPQYESDSIEQSLALDNSIVEYYLLDSGPEQGVDLMLAKLSEWDFPYGAVAVLAQSHEFLRKIESKFRASTGVKTEVMFWRSEEMADEAFRKHHDERDLKLFFDGDQTERMKFSTIESFKGFEASCVFLFIENQIFKNGSCLMELLYAGITRARQQLIICNMDNKEFHSILRKIIQQN